MKLTYLLENIEYEIIKGSANLEITQLVYDSKKATKESVFVCIRGFKEDGNKYVAEAILLGAKVIVTECDDLIVKEEITVILVKDTREALSHMSAAYFKYPANKLITIAITGTKGKTTTAYMIKEILENAGYKTGLIGTIETITGKEIIQNENTTPESYLIQEYLFKMLESGCSTVVMEVSSQGLKYKRVEGITFDYGIFMNISVDHIGEREHKDFKEYLYYKSLLFKKCRIGIINIDDENANSILENHKCRVITYGLSEKAEVRASSEKLYMTNDCLGVSYTVTSEVEARIMVGMPGLFSVYNSLAAITVCSQFHIGIRKMQEILKNIKVKGRTERIETGEKYILLIDYAHNAESLKSLLMTLREYNPKRLICLFGCGGNRSKYRRVEMGELSSKLADFSVITSDNPRDEDPMEIICDILEGVWKENGEFYTIANREKAIEYVIEQAKEGDIIVLAGKGHETYQEIKGKKYKMDERKIISNIYEKRKIKRDETSKN